MAEAFAAFKPQGNQIALLVSSPVFTSAAIQPLTGPQSGEVTFLFWNQSNFDVQVGVGATPAQAASNAVFPPLLGLDSVSRVTLSVPARMMVPYTLSADPFLAAIPANAGSFAANNQQIRILVIPGHGS